MILNQQKHPKTSHKERRLVSNLTLQSPTSPRRRLSEISFEAGVATTMNGATASNNHAETGKLQTHKISRFIQGVKKRFLPAQCNDNGDDDGKDAAANLLSHFYSCGTALACRRALAESTRCGRVRGRCGTRCCSRARNCGRTSTRTIFASCSCTRNTGHGFWSR